MLIYSTIYHYTNLISILIDGHEDYTQVFKSKIIQFSMHRSIDALRYLSRLIELAWDYYTNERRNKAICQILVTQWIKSPGKISCDLKRSKFRTGFFNIFLSFRLQTAVRINMLRIRFVCSRWAISDRVSMNTMDLYCRQRAICSAYRYCAVW